MGESIHFAAWERGGGGSKNNEIPPFQEKERKKEKPKIGGKFAKDKLVKKY